MYYKKAITPVVTISLLLLVTVLSVSFFSGWFDDFSSSLFIDTEQALSQSDLNSIKNIMYVQNNYLYIKSSDNSILEITDILVNGKSCNINLNLTDKSYSKLELNKCLKNMPIQLYNLDIISNSGILNKKIFNSKIIERGMECPEIDFMFSGETCSYFLESYNLFGNKNWTVDSSEKFEGNSGLKISDLKNGEYSVIEIEVILDKPKYLSFEWQVAGYSGYDNLGFCQNKIFGTESCTHYKADFNPVSGLKNWTNNQYYLSAGTHKLLWYYKKTTASNANGNYAMIDNIQFNDGLPQDKQYIFSGDIFPPEYNSYDLSGNDNWRTNSNVVLDGSKSLEISKLRPQNFVAIDFNVTLLTDKYLSFFWETTGHNGYDRVGFCHNKTYGDADCVNTYADITPIHGLVNWTQIQYFLLAGNHKLTWYYYKRAFSTKNGNLAHIDNISFNDKLSQDKKYVFNGETTPLEYNSYDLFGPSNWKISSKNFTQGTKALEIKLVPRTKYSLFELNVTLDSPKTISFDWMIRSHPGYDYIGFCLNKNYNDADCKRNVADITPISGLVDWVNVNYPIPSGTHKLTWYFVKIAHSYTNGNYGMIDNITFS